MSAHVCLPLVSTPLDGAVPDQVVRVARTLDDLMQVVALRSLVYMGEQNCPYREEFDGNDFAGSTHLLLHIGGEPAGVVRVRWFADFAKVERVSVRREHRGGDAVLVLVRAAFDLARRKGYRKILGHAQVRLAAHWERHFEAHPRLHRDRFAFSDHEYVEVEVDLEPDPDAIGMDTDPMILLRPEGAWDRPGVLDASAGRQPTNPV